MANEHLPKKKQDLHYLGGFQVNETRNARNNERLGGTPSVSSEREIIERNRRALRYIRGRTMTEQIILLDNEGNARKSTKYSSTLDEAIEATGNGKFQRILIILTGLCAFSGVLECANIGVALPYARCDLDISSTQQGLLSAVAYFAIFATIYMWGFMADTYGRQRMLRICTAGGFFFAFSSAFAVDVTWLIVLRFMAGAFLAGTQSITFTYIAEFHSSAKAARAAALVVIFLPAGWIVTSLLSMVFIPMEWVLWIGPFPFKPWRLLLISCSLFSLWNAFVFSYLPESPKFLLATDRKDEALEVLRRIYAFNTGESKKMYPVADIVLETNLVRARAVSGAWNIVQSIWKQTRPIFQAPLSHNTWKISLVVFIILAVSQGNTAWFPYFLVQLLNYHGPPTTICNIIMPNKPSSNVTSNACDSIDTKDFTSSQILMVAAAICVVLATLPSYCLNRLNLKAIVALWLAAAVGVSIALTFYLTSFRALVIGYFLLISIIVCFNFQMAHAVTLYPVNCRAVATSFIVMCGRLGSAFGAFVIGIFLGNDCNGMFYAFAASLIVCIVIAMFITRRTT